MRKKDVAKAVIGIALIGLILFLVDINKVATAMAGADSLLLLMAIAVTPITMFLRFVRWEAIISLGGTKVGLLEAAKIYMVGFFFGTITPSKVGDLLKFRYLHRDHGIARGTAFSLSIMDRIFDMLMVIAMSIIAMPILYKTGALFSIAVFIVVFGVMLYILFNQKIFRRIVFLFLPKISAITRIIGFKHNADNNTTFEDIYKPFGEIKRSKTKLLAITLLSVVIWLSVGFQMLLILLALGVKLNFLPILTFFCLATMVGLIPVTISGLGTREVTMIFLFSLLGVASEKTVSASLIEFIIGQIVVTVVGGVIYSVLRGRQAKTPSCGEAT